MIRTVEINTSTVDRATRKLLVRRISRRFCRVSGEYVEKCFDRYPQAALHYQNNKLLGIFFYNFFSEQSYGYFYFGPLFFFKRSAFALCTLKIMHKLLRQYARVAFLAEVQNPELIIHLQSIFKRNIIPKPFSFAISEHAQSTLRKFQQHITQLDEINIQTFASQATSSLFYRNRKANLMTTWLARNGIDLLRDQSLVMLIELTYKELMKAKLRILYRYLTYPSHKTAYLKTIKSLMRKKHANTITASAYRTEN